MNLTSQKLQMTYVSPIDLVFDSRCLLSAVSKPHRLVWITFTKCILPFQGNWQKIFYTTVFTNHHVEGRPTGTAVAKRNELCNTAVTIITEYSRNISVLQKCSKDNVHKNCHRTREFTSASHLIQSLHVVSVHTLLTACRHCDW